MKKITHYYYVVFLCLFTTQMFSQAFTEVENNNSIGVALASSQERIYSSANYQGTVTSADSDYWVLSRKTNQATDNYLYFDRTWVDSNPDFNFNLWEYQGGNWGSTPVNIGTFHSLKEVSGIYSYRVKLPYASNVVGGVSNNYYAIQIFTSAISYNYNFLIKPTTLNGYYYCYELNMAAANPIQVNDVDVALSTLSVNGGEDVYYVVKFSATNSFTDFTDNYIQKQALPTPAATNSYSGSGEHIVYVGTDDGAVQSALTMTNLSKNTTYYYKVYSYSNCNGYINYNNSGVPVAVTTCPGTVPNTGTINTVTPTSATTTTINTLGRPAGADTSIGYLVKFSDANSFTPPTSGTTLPTVSTDYSGKSGEQVVYTGAVGSAAGSTDDINQIISGLQINTNYYVKVYTYDLCGGIYNFETTGSAVVTSNYTCAAPTSAVSNVSASSTGTNTMNVSSFTSPSNASQGTLGYIVKVSDTDSFTTPVTVPSTTSTVYNTATGGEQIMYVGNSNTPNLAITGLVDATTYYVKVYAYNTCAGTNYFETAGSTTENITTCGAPTGNSQLLSFKEDLTFNNRLSPIITNVPSEITGHVVKVNTVDSFTDITGNLATLPVANVTYSGSGEQVILASTSGEGHAFTAYNLESNKEYFFKIYSYRECNGQYYFSNTNHSTSKFTAGVTPNLASNVIYSNLTGTSLTIDSFTGAPTPTNASGTPTGYVIKMNTVNSFTPYGFQTTLPNGNAVYSGSGEQVVWSSQDYTRPASPSTTPNVTITGLTAGTTYYFTIYAMHNALPYQFESYQQVGYEFSIKNDASLLAPNITFNNVTVNADDANFNLNATSDSSGAINYKILDNGGTNVGLSGANNATVTIGSKSGTVIIEAYQEASATHQSASETMTLTIEAASATLSGVIFYQINSGVTTVDMTQYLSSDSTGAYSFEIVGNTLGYSVNGNLLNVNNVAGSIIIKVTQAADATYSETVAYYSTLFYDPSNKTGMAHNLFDFSLDTGESKTIDTALNLLSTITTYSIVDNGGTGSTITNNVFTAGNTPGTVILRASTPNDNFYNAATTDVTVTVTGTLTQSITFNPLAVKTYGDTAFDLTATASSGLDVTYASSDTSVATISGSTITIVGAGNATITASQAGNGTYDPATAVQQNLVVDKKMLVVAPKPVTITYGVLDLPADNSTENYEYEVTGLVNGDLEADVLKLTTLFSDISDLVINNASNPGQPLAVGTHNDAMTWGTPPVLDILSPNYTYRANATSAITVNAAPLTVSAVVKSKDYDGTSATDPILTYTVDKSNLPTGADVYTYPSTFAFTGTLSRTGDQNAGTYKVQQGTLTLDANYAITFNEADFTINKVDLSATSVSNKTYGDVLSTLPIQYSGFVNGEDASIIDTPPTAIPAVTVDETTPVGAPYVVNLTGGIDNNYNIIHNNGTVTVTKRSLMAAIDNQTKVYGDVNPTFTVQYSNFVNGDTEADITQNINYSAYETGGSTYVSETTGVGEYFITNLPGQFIADNYWIQLTNLGVAKLTITARPIEVTADVKNKVYGEVDPTLTYQITSGNLVNGDAFTGSMLREAGETVFNNLPTNPFYKINQGTLALNANYNLTFVSGNFRISPRNVNFSLENASKVYGEVDPIPTVTIVDGTTMAYDDDFALTNVARSAGENVGSYGYGFIGTGIFEFDITSSHSTDVNNYQFNFRSYGSPALTITKADQNITFNALADKTYGDVAFDLTATASSGLDVTYVSSNTSVATISGNTVTIIGAGTTTITASQDGDGNNNAAVAVQQNLTVDKKILEITPSITTIAYGAKVDFSGTTPLNVSGFVNGDNVSVLEENTAFNYRIDYLADVTKVPLNVGMHSNQLGVNSSSNLPYKVHTNYNYSYPKIDITVVPREVTITANASQSKVYRDAEPTLTYSTDVPNDLVNLVLYDTSTFSLTGSLERVAGENVGTYAINQGNLAATTANYTLKFVTNDFEITPASVIITADAKSKVYGESDPAFTYTVTTGAAIGSDAFTGSLERVAGENVGTYAINQGTLVVDSNYDVTYVGKNLSITAKTIEVTADAKTKVYGALEPALTYQITSGSLKAGDAFTGSLERVAGEDVGTYTINQGNLALNANYILSYVNDDLSITPKAIEVTAAAKTKTYGALDPALTYQITSGSLEVGDAFTGSLERIAGNNVGSYTIN